ncbi:hypothetical protein FV222_08970 [Methylobacterium sp. WL103]|uniref:hypothetical protein n=1 Tax=Methylobacterium sp. WL103 TaxID=2603891 RepID=UPI0011C6F1C7|nr:hypothetical protein [Methylobacterium sp. WL103]TXN02987.1 hypothetical protein FV222_08970 [Methylobacterium sp. WL103]
MQASLEFLTFGRWFIPDLDHDAPTLDEKYAFVLNLFRSEERVRLRQFLDRALREASDATLERLWKETDADIYFFTAQDLRAFLAGARDRN